MSERAALGFRAHSGWAVAVAVAGSPDSPAILDRRRIELVDPEMPRQPYHAAEPLALEKAEALVTRCVRAARLRAQQALRAVIDDLRKQGHVTVACGNLQASGRPLPSLAETLASHALIHAAEGQLFRDALSHAAEHWRLPVTGVREREILTRAAAQFGFSPEQLQHRLNDMGRAIGPPWRQDEKYAALAAWLSLSNPT